MSLLLLHAICLTTSETRARTVQGLRGHSLECIEVGGFGAWVTAWAGPRRLGREDVLAAHRLVSGLGDVLPVRLPTWFADADALGVAVHRHREALGTALARVSGRVEVALTLRWAVATDAPPSDGPRTQSGTHYLVARQRALKAEDARRARAEALRSALVTTLGEVVVESEHRVCPGPLIALSSAFLVQRDAAAAVMERLSAFGQAEEDVRILVHGPWPPYTFARIPTIST